MSKTAQSTQVLLVTRKRSWIEHCECLKFVIWNLQLQEKKSYLHHERMELIITIKKLLLARKLEHFHNGQFHFNVPRLFSRRRQSAELSIHSHWYCRLDDWYRFLASCVIVRIYEIWSCTLSSANKPMNANTARQSCLTKSYHRIEHSASIT